MKLDQDRSLAELPDGWSIDRLKDVVGLRADVARVGLLFLPFKGCTSIMM
jgi:hypothetical protein